MFEFVIRQTCLSLIFTYICNMRRSEMKQHIVETASMLFYQKGYNSTGINEIIAKSNIAKATLYSHFKSKEDICVAYLKFKNSTFLHDIEAYCLLRSEGEMQLLALFDFLQEFFIDRDFNGCWCIKTVAEIPKENEKIRTEIQQQKQSFLQLIEKLLQANFSAISATKSKHLARQIYLLYESGVTESHLHQEDWPIKEARELCARILK